MNIEIPSFCQTALLGELNDILKYSLILPLLPPSNVYHGSHSFMRLLIIYSFLYPWLFQCLALWRHRLHVPVSWSRQMHVPVPGSPEGVHEQQWIQAACHHAAATGEKIMLHIPFETQIYQMERFTTLSLWNKLHMLCTLLRVHIGSFGFFKPVFVFVLNIIIDSKCVNVIVL